MSKVRLGDVAVEHKETCKNNKNGYPIVGLEHLIPEEITLSNWDEGSDNMLLWHGTKSCVGFNLSFKVKI